ncbi:MAG: hypothetical protein OXM03_08405 [Chloroflexota bacterium]|nr:hypothetical protein [Chloroflexota bacterium]MDE2840634.1 hypothetical protein [Chloroflexota bacterium]MDE2931620.1 hypothetical protein [Chloroflexota bacterium]
MYDYLRHRIQLEYSAAWRVALSGLFAGVVLPAVLWLGVLLLSRWVSWVTAPLLWIACGAVLYLSLAGAAAALANQRVSRRNDFGLVAGAAVFLALCLPLGLLVTETVTGGADTGLAANLRAMLSIATLLQAVVPTLLAGLLLTTAWAALLVPCTAWLNDADWQAIMDRMVNETYHRDWIKYNQNFIDQKKIAYYLKTGQDEKAAALEAEAAKRAQHVPTRETDNG